MWDLVENPEDRISHNEAHIFHNRIIRRKELVKPLALCFRCIKGRFRPNVFSQEVRNLLNELFLVFFIINKFMSCLLEE